MRSRCARSTSRGRRTPVVSHRWMPESPVLSTSSWSINVVRERSSRDSAMSARVAGAPVRLEAVHSMLTMSPSRTVSSALGSLMDTARLSPTVRSCWTLSTRGMQVPAMSETTKPVRTSTAIRMPAPVVDCTRVRSSDCRYLSAVRGMGLERGSPTCRPAPAGRSWEPSPLLICAGDGQAVRFGSARPAE